MVERLAGFSLTFFFFLSLFSSSLPSLACPCFNVLPSLCDLLGLHGEFSLFLFPPFRPVPPFFTISLFSSYPLQCGMTYTCAKSQWAFFAKRRLVTWFVSATWARHCFGAPCPHIHTTSGAATSSIWNQRSPFPWLRSGMPRHCYKRERSPCGGKCKGEVGCYILSLLNVFCDLRVAVVVFVVVVVVTFLLSIARNCFSTHILRYLLDAHCLCVIISIDLLQIDMIQGLCMGTYGQIEVYAVLQCSPILEPPMSTPYFWRHGLYACACFYPHTA